MVLEASYGPIDPDPEARDLAVDVTVAIRALVHKSQLYIHGHRSKLCWTRFRASISDHFLFLHLISGAYSRVYRGFTTLRPRSQSRCEYGIYLEVERIIVRFLTISQLSFLWEVSGHV